MPHTYSPQELLIQTYATRLERALSGVDGNAVHRAVVVLRESIEQTWNTAHSAGFADGESIARGVVPEETL